MQNKKIYFIKRADSCFRLDFRFQDGDISKGREVLLILDSSRWSGVIDSHVLCAIASSILTPFNHG